MAYKIRFIAAAALLLLSFAAVPAISADDQQGTLEADNIDYNVNTKKAHAVGNVVIKHKGATMYGSTADGFIEKQDFTVQGAVRGLFPEQKATLKADKVKWNNSNTEKKNGSNGLVEAFGKVYITHEPADRLNSDYARWQTETNNYYARGSVDGVYGPHALKSSEAGRENDRFWAVNVKRYEDRERRIVMSAARVDGTLVQNAVKTVTAVGNVIIDYIDKDGLKTHLTGGKAVYVAGDAPQQGVITVTEDARAVRSDGKRVAADKLVMHEVTKNIEAVGHSKIMFITTEKKTAAEKTGKTGKKK